MLKTTLYKVFGTRNDRLLKGYNKVVEQINRLEEQISKLSDNELQAKTVEFKNRYAMGETLDMLLPEVFAVCREASLRVLEMRHFDVQLIGGMVLHGGKIAEMRTGEGKTLVATLAVYLNAITGNGVHVVTVNDYLANRDASQMSKLYNFLGLSVGINLPNMSPESKKAAYLADITYGTNNEFGFDYLRDNMVFDNKDKVQRDLAFAVVDEVDSILIDEARTPLIISGSAEGSEDLYVKLNKVPKLLKPQEEEDSVDGDFWVDEKHHNVVLSELGHEKIERILSDMGLLKDGDSLYSVHNISLMHHLMAALKAHYVYHRDQHYVVQDGEVVIVDEFTGRLMSGRRWSDGLHQAVEAKENVAIQKENQTMATITFQNYFRMYKKLAGMTGTADTEAFEFQQIYKLETVVIPTNQTMIRKDYNDKIYMNLEDKYNAIIEDIKDCHQNGQPVLIGTTSVENSEIIAKFLSKANLKHAVLNAKQHASEADIIVQAGRPGAITVATNMAGRGTDIILGGNPKPEILQIENDGTLSLEIKKNKIAEINHKWLERNKQVLEAGGLYIIGTERHESRRIDNQLRGRAGRQGDPGASRFYLSLDDSLLRIFGGERMRGMMQRLGMNKGEAIEHKWLSRSIESAQRKVEGHNFDIRKQLLEYDDVSNEQRRVIYAQRDEILKSNDLSELSLDMIKGVIGENFDNYIPHKSMPDDWDIIGLERILADEFLLNYSITNRLKQDPNVHDDTIKSELLELATTNYKNKMAEFGSLVIRDIDNFVNSVIGDTLESWNTEALNTFCMQNGFNLIVNYTDYVSSNPGITRQELLAKFYENLGDMGKYQINKFERSVLLQQLDYCWRDHLTQLEQLRQGIHLRGYAQKDPKQEYKQESFGLFASMLDNVKRDVVRTLLSVKFQGAPEVIPDNNQNALIAKPNITDPALDGEKIAGRNSPCPCKSGKKYKHCCGKL